MLNVLRRISSFLSLILPVLFVLALFWSVASTWNAFSGGQSVPAAEASPVVPSGPSPAPLRSPTATPGNAQAGIQPGDTLKLSFFEKLAAEEEQKWTSRSQMRRPPRSFLQRTELNGSYDLQEDGTILVPLLGSIPAAGLTLAELQVNLGKAFEQYVGRLAYVSVVVERQPVYVLGPVKRPGTYKSAPGFTVLHVLALAGGLDRPVVDLSNMLQTVREVEKRQSAIETAKRSWARLVVLRAERDGVEPSVPAKLISLAGEAQAAELLQAERAVRDLAVNARRAQEQALAAAEESANAALARKQERLLQGQSNVKLRQERVGDLTGLVKKGTIGRPSYVQAEAELSDVKERVQETMVSVEEAENKVKQLTKERVKFQNDGKVELEREIQRYEDQIKEAENALTASSGSIGVIRSALANSQDGGDGGLEFELVRNSPSGREVLLVPGTFELKPGDLLRVKIRKLQQSEAPAGERTANSIAMAGDRARRPCAGRPDLERQPEGCGAGVVGSEQ